MKRITPIHFPGALDLTQRELTLLSILEKGGSNGEIADELEVTVHTVKYHLKNIYDKLGAKSRIQAIVFAQRSGVLGTRLVD